MLIGMGDLWKLPCVVNSCVIVVDQIRTGMGKVTDVIAGEETGAVMIDIAGRGGKPN